MTSGSLWNYYRHKSTMLILMIVHDLSIKRIVRETPESRNPWDTDQPAQPPVPFLSAKETIRLKYL